MGNWVTLRELGERRCTAIKIKWNSTTDIDDSGNYNFSREYGVQGSEWGVWGSNFRFDLTAENVCDANINGGSDTFYNTNGVNETFQGEYNGKEYYITYDGEYVQWEWTEPVYYYGFNSKGDYDPAPVAADFIYVMLEGAEEPDVPDVPDVPENPTTIADNLNRIIQAKADIKVAIENKGVVVGDITIDSYAEKINQIEQGESGKIKLPDGICLSGSTFTELDMSQWDWSNVHYWEKMFNQNSNLTTLHNFPTNIKAYGSMANMISGCPNLTSLNLSNLDTSNVTNMINMFNNCRKLTSLDLSNWDTSKVTDMSNMFAYCSQLTEVKMGGDVSKVNNVGSMFNSIYTTGTFYYNSQYDYSKIIAVLPSKWTAVPME